MVKLYKIKAISLIASLSIILSGCSEWSHNDKDNTVIKTYENLEPYEHIDLRGIFKVKLKQNEDPGVILSGKRNQLENIKENSDTNHLKIQTEENDLLKFDYKKPELTILVDSLRELWSYQPISLISQDTIRSKRLKMYVIGELSESNLIIRTNYFRFVNSSTSTGKYTIRGKTEKFYCRLRGSSHLEARELKAEHVRFQT